jgi:hypothetical protein
LRRGDCAKNSVESGRIGGEKIEDTSGDRFWKPTERYNDRINGQFVDCFSHVFAHHCHALQPPPAAKQEIEIDEYGEPNPKVEHGVNPEKCEPTRITWTESSNETP